MSALLTSMGDFFIQLLGSVGIVAIGSIALALILNVVARMDIILSIAIGGLPIFIYLVTANLIVGWLLGVLVIIYGLLLFTGVQRIWMQR